MDTLFEGDFVGTLIPQKFPVVMVDKLYDYTESSVSSGLTINAGNIFLHNGQFAEAGLVEHMAQTIALHTGYTFYLKRQPAPTGYIGAIKEITITELPKLGDEIQTTATVIQEFAGVTLVEISTKVNGMEIACGQMKTVLAPK